MILPFRCRHRAGTDLTTRYDCRARVSPMRLYRCLNSFLISKRWDMLTPSWKTSPGFAPVSSVTFGSPPDFNLAVRKDSGTNERTNERQRRMARQDAAERNRATEHTRLFMSVEQNTATAVDLCYPRQRDPFPSQCKRTVQENSYHPHPIISRVRVWYQGRLITIWR